MQHRVTAPVSVSASRRATDVAMIMNVYRLLWRLGEKGGGGFRDSTAGCRYVARFDMSLSGVD